VLELVSGAVPQGDWVDARFKAKEINRVHIGPFGFELRKLDLAANYFDGFDRVQIVLKDAVPL
jgi:hypothetical protein